ncbi:MAG: hypothetical protein QIT40_gp19 [Lokiarchaeia virus VerdaV4]|uniref:Uncharacterized protein n=1 Tax=Lokiarchaeia virus VerdaV4 TaxID=3070172 RepID=A0AA35G7D2_9CAUD|nr:MAG: hypothetical protein QIT40_gp19 [Lokiarchaeia virus VerdaV4]BDI54977.1 MAG: hypothetical protein [Lokiarchaeia virus VerdaV4]
MKIKIIGNWINEIKYKVEFKDGIVIYREIHRYAYAIHRNSTKVIPLKTKSIYIKAGW